MTRANTLLNDRTKSTIIQCRYQDKAYAQRSLQTINDNASRKKHCTEQATKHNAHTVKLSADKNHWNTLLE